MWPPGMAYRNQKVAASDCWAPVDRLAWVLLTEINTYQENAYPSPKKFKKKIKI